MASLREIRYRLIGQHADIRIEIDAVRIVCEVLPIDRPRLGKIMTRMIEKVRTHNLAEEDALRNVLPELDVFGNVRKEVMISEHAAEHENLRATLVAATGSDSTATVGKLLELMDRIGEHMNHEENLFLSARLLDRDDAPDGAS